MTLETMIDTLSRDEKLAAMDLIWRDLAADSRSFASPVGEKHFPSSHGRLVIAVLFALASSGGGGCRSRAEPAGERPAAVRFVQTGHVSNLRRAEFSGDGRWLLTVSVDGETILWDARDGRPLRVLNEIGPLHQPINRVVELRPDGSQILLTPSPAITSRTGSPRCGTLRRASGSSRWAPRRGGGWP